MDLRVFVTSIIILSQFELSLSSNYEITLDRIVAPLGDDDKIIKFTSLRVKKFNRTAYVVNGKYNVLRPFTDSMVVKGVAYNLQGGQYKKMGDKVVENPLTAMYNNSESQEYFDIFQSHQTIPYPWLTNPWPAGENEVNNYLVEDYASVLPPYLPGGEKWMFELRAFENDELLGGYDIYGTIRNQRSLLEGK